MSSAVASSRTRRTTNLNTRTWKRAYSTCIASRSPFAIRPISTSSGVDCIRTRHFSRTRLPLGSRWRPSCFKVVHVADLLADPTYAQREPEVVTGVELGGIRTLLIVPMLKEKDLIGA